MKKRIFIGYEVGSGKEVYIPLTHLIVTGITQESGKTTTLEALIKRGNLRAIVFKTKIGETGFSEGTVIPPYYKERSDWQYVQTLLEATLKEKLKFERSWIIRACKNASSLIEVKANIDRILAEEKLRALDRSMFTNLQAYLELVLPQLQYANFSRTLNLTDGINIMDLERFSREVQSLVIQSTLETVLKEMRNVVIILPECWKFIPERLGNPVKRTAEEFIRQGASNNNYLWLDSQDITGVWKTILKQVSTWILGYQREINEVKRTLDQLPLPKRMKPSPSDIMSLKLGHFYVATSDFVKKVYVQPAWLDSKTAKLIAKGKIKVEEIKKPEKLVPFTVQPIKPVTIEKTPIEAQRIYAKVQQDLVELRQDFFNKIEQLQQTINRIGEELFKLQTSRQEVNVDEIVSLVMQKIPIINKAEIISEILSKIPKISGTVTYEVSPLEKLTKDFLEETKNKILSDISSLSPDEKKILKYLESQQRGVTTTEVLEKCLFLSPTSGSNRQKVTTIFKKLDNLKIARYDIKHGRCYPNLKERLRNMLQTFKASEEEINQVYNHIIFEMLRE